jgi:hypothetical protein
LQQQQQQQKKTSYRALPYAPQNLSDILLSPGGGSCNFPLIQDGTHNHCTNLTYDLKIICLQAAAASCNQQTPRPALSFIPLQISFRSPCLFTRVQTTARARTLPARDPEPKPPSEQARCSPAQIYCRLPPHQAPSTLHPPTNTSGSKFRAAAAEVPPPRPPHPPPPPRVSPRLAGAPRPPRHCRWRWRGASRRPGSPESSLAGAVGADSCGVLRLGLRWGTSGGKILTLAAGFRSRALSCASAMPGWSDGDC